MYKHFAIWSADYTQTTGQAQVTRRVVEHILVDAAGWRQYVYRLGGLQMVASWAGAGLRLWCDIALRRVHTLYLVCSRSNSGFLRDVPALLVTFAGVRVVVHAHGSDIVDLLDCRPLSPLARALYMRCELIVPSSHLLEPLRRMMGERLHLCENYFAADPVALHSRTKVTAASNVLNILWNSNIMASKGFFDLAEAVERLHQQGHAVRLISIGTPLDDEEMHLDEVLCRLEMYKICDWFDHRGWVDPDTSIALTSVADVVALPSRYSSECQPLAIIQAMCTGTAIVASDIPALRATLRNYPAEFVPEHSVEGLVGALSRVHIQKQSDPTTFIMSREQHAKNACERFAAERFDAAMQTILLRTMLKATMLNR